MRYTGWVDVNLFVPALKKTSGDTNPDALIDALSNIIIDTPAGPITTRPHRGAFVGTRDFYILKTEKVGDRIHWPTAHTHRQVNLVSIE